MRHLSREGDDVGDGAERKQRADMLGERGIAEQAVRHRLAAQHCVRKRDRARDVAHVDPQAFAKRRHLVPGRCGISLIVGERRDMHRRELRQRLEHMPATDAVAAIRRPGRAVHQKQDFGHYPNPRAISGPIRFATHSGSLFQRSTWRRYFALVGLVSRAVSPGASQRA